MGEHLRARLGLSQAEAVCNELHNILPLRHRAKAFERVQSAVLQRIRGLSLPTSPQANDLPMGPTT